MSTYEQEFFCKRDNLNIRCRQYFPEEFDEKKKYPAVITCHGFTGNVFGTAEFCRGFAKRGYVAFSFNFCGGGRVYEDNSLKSEGVSTDMTILTEVEDVIAVKNYVKKLPWIDMEKLVLMGLSQGGLVAALAAARCSSEFSKLILGYPAFSIPYNARAGRLGGVEFDPQNVPELFDCGKTVISKKYYDAVINMEPYEEAVRYEGPVLILQGLEDKTVLPSYSIRARECYGEDRCKLILMEGMGHGFDEDRRAKALEDIEEFLKL